MTDAKNESGQLAWIDLTVNNAVEIKNFYQQVIGWREHQVDMGEYSDFAMMPSETDDAVAGICHAKGPNQDLPAVWLPYFLVEDLDAAVEQTRQNGGKCLTEVKAMGADKFVVIQDPAGASCALYQKGQSTG
ncbi:VOC family protein [Endozoicomonas sp. G2_1]|uniref:VOC family protein n=1 Tax=Endozoicomonas sp. G2_1 TaxID=2821091 RepID=UPI001ADCB308|nr:VOC family protein [Endozoicomonas sp. G2_1]MBO9491940.1 VOC family protein [Endozoicomonas sp. G2_1]